MDSGLYSMILQISLQIVSAALHNPNYIQVIDTLNSAGHIWSDDVRRVLEESVVSLGMLSPESIALLEMWELDLQNCCLQTVETAVVTDNAMFVFLESAMITELQHRCCHAVIARDDCAPVTTSTEVFGGIKTETSGITHRPRSSAMVTGAMCLRGVFD